MTEATVESALENGMGFDLTLGNETKAINEPGAYPFSHGGNDLLAVVQGGELRTITVYSAAMMNNPLVNVPFRTTGATYANPHTEITPGSLRIPHGCFSHLVRVKGGKLVPPGFSKKINAGLLADYFGPWLKDIEPDESDPLLEIPYEQDDPDQPGSDGVTFQTAPFFVEVAARFQNGEREPDPLYLAVDRFLATVGGAGTKEDPGVGVIFSSGWSGIRQPTGKWMADRGYWYGSKYRGSSGHGSGWRDDPTDIKFYGVRRPPEVQDMSSESTLAGRQYHRDAHNTALVWAFFGLEPARHLHIGLTESDDAAWRVGEWWSHGGRGISRHAISMALGSLFGIRDWREPFSEFMDHVREKWHRKLGSRWAFSVCSSTQRDHAVNWNEVLKRGEPAHVTWMGAQELGGHMTCARMMKYGVNPDGTPNKWSGMHTAWWEELTLPMLNILEHALGGDGILKENVGLGPSSAMEGGDGQTEVGVYRRILGILQEAHWSGLLPGAKWQEYVDRVFDRIVATQSRKTVLRQARESLPIYGRYMEAL